MARTIFIADDEADFVSTLRSRLEFEGYVVTTAADGKEALQRITDEKPDLILLDIMMPTMNGYQVCRELKVNADTRPIPVLMLTAKSQESDKFWGKEAGADDYVTKPFDMEDLIEKIGGLLAD
ncbi:MAG: response regulator [Gemmatimonadales bacterium]|nr:response regulator [Gemmatimonadales bacterium]NIN11872.1 response regulator [Gemmatimonadales bacterium]NIN50422.1 response regulator [Gemmatimonadales bacterium]NIP07886.1 response regulator [Gemmatimonadales bacterium]NIR02090.1 response regulator [Gemmatimonadales bacterium]